MKSANKMPENRESLRCRMGCDDSKFDFLETCDARDNKSCVFGIMSSRSGDARGAPVKGFMVPAAVIAADVFNFDTNAVG